LAASKAPNKKLHAEAKSGAFFVFRFASFYTKKHATSGSGELGVMCLDSR